MKSRLAVTLLATCGLAACIKNKEAIVVQPDGALQVELSAEGGVADLADGYPLPLGGRWQALDDATLRWIEKLGPDTGSAETQANLARGALEGQDTRLAVRATFASASELPRTYAPEREPYRTAFLDRETKLSVRSVGGRTVYTFERTFGARTWGQLWVLGQLESALPEELSGRIQKNEPLTDADWSTLTPIVVAAYEQSARLFAREALWSLYTEGDASLPSVLAPEAVEAVAAELRARLTEERLRAVYAAMTDPQSDADFERDPSLNPDLILRAAIRSALDATLARAHVAAGTRNALFERLEWNFTAFDASVDLQDEDFAVEVTMPGAVVSGNFAALEGSRASWSFAGKELDDRPVVLRVVSVVE